MVNGWNDATKIKFTWLPGKRRSLALETFNGRCKRKLQYTAKEALRKRFEPDIARGSCMRGRVPC